MLFSKVIILYSENFYKPIDLVSWQDEEFLHINAWSNKLCKYMEIDFLCHIVCIVKTSHLMHIEKWLLCVLRFIWNM
jgi:hypothetical protein